MSRLYTTPDGQQYPSVTTVLGILDKPALKQWAVDCTITAMHNGIPEVDARLAWCKVSGDAMDIGSIVHRAIERSIRYNQRLTFVHREHRQKVENAYGAWCEWYYDDVQPRYIATEQKVFNDEQMYAGTLDGIVDIDGVRYVVDYKTNNYQSFEYQMQIAAYAKCVGVDRGLLLNLDKDTGNYKATLYTPEKMAHAYEAFTVLLKYYYMAAKRRLDNPRAKEQR